MVIENNNINGYWNNSKLLMCYDSVYSIILLFFPIIVDSHYCLPCEPLGGSTAICKHLTIFFFIKGIV